MLTCQGAKNGIYQSGGYITIQHIWIENISERIYYSQNNTDAYGGIFTITGGTIRNSATNTEVYAFYISPRTIINIAEVAFMGSIALGGLIENQANNNNDNINFDNCSFSSFKDANFNWSRPMTDVGISDNLLTLYTNRCIFIHGPRNYKYYWNRGMSKN